MDSKDVSKTGKEKKELFFASSSDGDVTELPTSELEILSQTSEAVLRVIRTRM